MIVAVLLLLLLQAAPTVATVDGLPPAEAGAVILRGKMHGPIDEVAVVPPEHIEAPGFVKRDLVERPVRLSSGCARRRWEATFRSPTLQREGVFVLDYIVARTEIAPTVQSECPTNEYIHLNSGIDQAEGLAALSQIERVRTGRAQTAFDCADKSDDSEFCRSRATILRELATRKPWILSRDGSWFAVSLKGEGPTIVLLRFDPTAPERVAVSKKYPWPF